MFSLLQLFRCGTRTSDVVTPPLVPPPLPAKTVASVFFTPSNHKNPLVDGTDIQFRETKYYLFPVKAGRVIRVYDGDTIHIAARHPTDPNSPLYRITLRLFGIDCPELTKNPSEAEKHIARLGRDFITKLVLNKVVQVELLKPCKYGARNIANVYFQGESLSNLLLKHKFAIPYDGKKKGTFEELINYHFHPHTKVQTHSGLGGEDDTDSNVWDGDGDGDGGGDTNSTSSDATRCSSLHDSMQTH